MKRRRISIIPIITAVTMIFTGCSSSVYEKSKSDYTQVTTVKAASFEVPTAFVSKATAISTIAENEEYDGLYIFKDGSTKYVMFDTSLIVIACGKTEFGFKGNETVETLESKSIEGVWLSSDGFDYSTDENDGIYKIVSDDLNAEYSLTKTQYCKLKGSMASVSDGTTEYSIFAGAVISDETDSLDSDQEKIIKHVVRSFRMTDAEEIVESDTKDNKDAATAEETAAENTEPELEADETQEATEEIEETEDIQVEEVTQATEKNPEEESSSADGKDEITSAEEDASETEDMIITVESDEDNKASEESINEENTDESKTTDESIEEENAAESDVNDVVEEAAQEDDWEMVEINPLKSTVYDPLTIGQWGMAGCITADGEQTVVDVRVDNIITGKDATKIIKQYNGRKSTPKEGTSFVVVEYTTDTSEKDAYVNLRFCGVDGERLKLRGVSYTTRSYDLDNTEEMQAEYTVPTYAHRYAYYEVPTGCKEYLLVFGEHIKEIDDVPTANYLIDIKR